MIEKVDNKTKWAYSVGGIGRDMAYALVSMFLLTYIQYTMRLTPAQFAAISAIIIGCRVWDAINDPMMGTIIENARLKFGKFKPWIIIGAIANSFLILSLFLLRPTGWLFVIFFGVAYLLWGMTFTINDISYWSMLPSLTSDPKERSSITTLMAVFASIGGFLAGGLVPMLIAGDAVKMFGIIAVIVVIMFAGCSIMTGVLTKERPRIDRKENITIKEMFKIIVKNDQLVVMAIVVLLYSLGSGLLLAFGFNFFTFEFGYGGGELTLFTVMYALGTLGSQLIYPVLNNKMSRDKLLNMAMIISVIGYIALMAFGYVLPKSPIILYVIGVVIFFGQGLFYMIMIIMLANTIEYDEARTGVRSESIAFSLRPFMVKLASAIQQGIVTLILIVSGIYAYSQQIAELEIAKSMSEITAEVVKKEANAIVAIAQSDPTMLLILRIFMVAVPLVLLFASYILIKKKYVINEEKYAEIMSTIEKRNMEKQK